jgi:hypothetical protein
MPGPRTSNRLRAVSFIMPGAHWAPRGPLVGPGPLEWRTRTRSGPDGISLPDSRRSTSFVRSNYEYTEGRHSAYCINSHRDI